MKIGVCSVVMSGSLVVFIHVYDRTAGEAYNHALMDSFCMRSPWRGKHSSEHCNGRQGRHRCQMSHNSILVNVLLIKCAKASLTHTAVKHEQNAVTL
ncbi:unnamed protein product, partial [Ectocarpus sp. 8 AP-2014]